MCIYICVYAYIYIYIIFFFYTYIFGIRALRFDGSLETGTTYSLDHYEKQSEFRWLSRGEFKIILWAIDYGNISLSSSLSVLFTYCSILQ